MSIQRASVNASISTLILLFSSIIAHSYKLSFQALTRSILHHGDPAMYDAVLNKLRNKECIHIGFIGGSVSDGRGLPKDATAYPGLFEQLVGEAFPCKGNHTHIRYIKGSTATDHWINFFVGRQEELLKDVDLVVVDTAVNDIYRLLKGASGKVASPERVLQDHTEILMSLLLQKSSRAPEWSSVAPSCRESGYTRAWTGAAVLWLGASTRRTEIWRGALPRSTDAVYAQLPVAITHGVAYISVIDGLGPFRTTESVAWLNNTWYSEPVRDIHPGAWGHQALAKALLHFLTEQMRYQEQLPWGGPPRRPSEEPYCPRPPAFVSQASLDIYLDSNPLHIPTVSKMATRPRMRNCTGWDLFCDVPDRPGLIALEVGSQCTIVGLPQDLGRHPLSVGQAHVMLLRSYEHMGQVRITVGSRPAVPRGDDGDAWDCDMGPTAEATILGSSDIDCLWEERVSEPKAGVVHFRVPEDMQEKCLTITFEVLDSPRPENKIKIVGLTVF